jgi:single-stranded-DNA-specific exonuclease
VNRRWELRPADPTQVEALGKTLGLSPLVARILAGRGLGDPEAARRFLELDLGGLLPPDELPDLRPACERLALAIARKEPITIFGDYDVDGATATAILVHFLRETGARVDYYLPDRLREGYGLTRFGIEEVARRGARLVVTVDCGTNSHDEIARARSLAMEVIVLDHHETPGGPSPALALVNPHRPDSTFPDRGLCSAGLAFYVVAGLRRWLRERNRFDGRPEPNLKAYLDLVALGTIADVAPLLGVNRTLVHHGLGVLAETRRPGLSSLKALAGIAPGPVSAGQVAFRMAPRLNAAGRMGDPRRAVDLLLAEDPEQARALAQELDRENARRQAVEQAVLDEALAQALADPEHARASAVVVAGEGWHPGVIGIVAARLAERLDRPAVVIALDGARGRGSARSVGDLNLYQSLAECREHLTGFGGHAQAAGLSLAAHAVAPFRRRFREVVSAVPEMRRVPRRFLDAEVPLSALSPALGEEMARLQPFGAGNPEPVLCSREAEVREARVVGGNHLRLRFAGTDAAAIGFGLGDEIPALGSRVDLCYNLRVSEWQGQRRAEIHILELVPSRGV